MELTLRRFADHVSTATRTLPSVAALPVLLPRITAPRMCACVGAAVLEPIAAVSFRRCGALSATSRAGR